jgi:membrane protein CcdC involved in cytochrome C biogenesis
MTAAQQSQLFTLVIVTAVIGLVMARRMRPQPVRPQRIAISGAIIVLLVASSLVGAGRLLIQNPISLLLIPVFVATMTFWVDQPTGQLWMKGGVLFAAILIGTIVLRFGIRYIVYGDAFGGYSSGAATRLSPSLALLSDASADLLFLSLGLWASRAFFLIQRHRASEAGSASG